MPSLAITGHTSGVGLAIAEHAQSEGWEVVGMSRANGFDITRPDQIIHAATHCDVFVNNAYRAYAQVDLLYQMAQAWADNPDKHIICMGSLSADGIQPSQRKYAIHKQALDGAVEQLQADPNIHCRISNIRFGFTDTPRVAHKAVPKLTPEQVAQECWHVLMAPYWIKRMDFRVMK